MVTGVRPLRRREKETLQGTFDRRVKGGQLREHALSEGCASCLYVTRITKRKPCASKGLRVVYSHAFNFKRIYLDSIRV